MTNLASRIAARGKNFKRSNLANASGVSQGTLYQILTGKLKNPGVYTVAKIAKVLGCSLDNLIGRCSQANIQDTMVALESIECKTELIDSCANALTELLQNKNQQLSLSAFISMLKTICEYSMHKKSDIVDEHFASWFVDHTLKSHIAQSRQNL